MGRILEPLFDLPAFLIQIDGQTPWIVLKMATVTGCFQDQVVRSERPDRIAIFLRQPGGPQILFLNGSDSHPLAIMTGNATHLGMR